MGASSGESACRRILSKAEPTASPPPSASRRNTSERQPSSSASASCRWAAELGPPPAQLQSAMEFVHFACTSEDVNNLAYGLMLKDAREGELVPT